MQLVYFRSGWMKMSGIADAAVDSTWYVGAAPAGHSAIEAGSNGSNVVKYWNDYGYAPNYENNASLRTNNLKEVTLTGDMVAGGSIDFSLDYAIADLGTTDENCRKYNLKGWAGQSLDFLRWFMAEH